MNRYLRRFTASTTLKILAFLAQRPMLAPLSERLARSLAHIIVSRKHLGQATTATELAEGWQRAFPSKQPVPIERIEDRTVYARILTPCPLRGTGNTAACWRMMAFDREVVHHAGGQFVVLQSQASPGQTFCRVAMRLAGENMADLRQAHEI
ncbi:MAG: hypothetical protein U1F76_22785 [Candidatus Competibacteraceae bacterium]